MTELQEHAEQLCRDHHIQWLRQVDQARGDLYAIGDDLEFIKSQLARLPTRKQMARLTLLATFTAVALVLVGLEALFR
jgi:hypothetical protein